MKPFLSAERYKFLTVVSALAVVVFSVVLYVATQRMQQSRMERKRQGENQSLSGREREQRSRGRDLCLDAEQVTTIQRKQSSKKKEYPSWMQLHGPTVMNVVGFFLVGLYIATYTWNWPLFFGFLLVAVTGLYNGRTYGPTRGKDQILATLFHYTGMLGSSSLLFAAMASVNTSYVLQSYAHYSYLGPMRIVGFQTYIGRNGTFNELFYREAFCPVEEYVSQILVSWGGSWGCPESGNIECLSYVDSYFCDNLVCTAEDTSCTLNCTDEEYESAENASLLCLQANYNETMELLDLGAEHDVDVYPDDDGVKWSTEVMYGDCSTCSAQWEFLVDSKRLEHNSYGYQMSYLFLVIGIFSGFCWLIMWNKNRQNDTQKARSVELLSKDAGVI